MKLKNCLKTGSLYLSMYMVTTIVVAVESGNVLMGAKIAIFTATIKTIVVKIHAWCWKERVANKTAVTEALTEMSIGD